MMLCCSPNSMAAILLPAISYSNDGDVTGHHGASGSLGSQDIWIVKTIVQVLYMEQRMGAR